MAVGFGMNKLAVLDQLVQCIVENARWVGLDWVGLDFSMRYLCSSLNTSLTYEWIYHLFTLQALIEDFDHLCPWTGTGIGGKNIAAFKFFVVCVNLSCYFSIGLVSYSVIKGIRL